MSGQIDRVCAQKVSTLWQYKLSPNKIPTGFVTELWQTDSKSHVREQSPHTAKTILRRTKLGHTCREQRDFQSGAQEDSHRDRIGVPKRDPWDPWQTKGGGLGRRGWGSAACSVRAVGLQAFPAEINKKRNFTFSTRKASSPTALTEI